MSINLVSEIVIRIIDTFGVFTKDMPDVRNPAYECDNKCYSGKADISNDEGLYFLLTDYDKKKYMICSLDGQIYFCMTCFDLEDSPGLNNIFVATIEDKEITFRETTIIEAANILVSFELVRHFCQIFSPHKPTDRDFKVMKEFIEAISEE